MATPKSSESTFQFFNEIGIIHQLANNAFESCLPDGLTISQFSVLNWFIRVDVEATPGRLATAFMVTKGAMTNTLKRLEGKGFVHIRPDENSGRRKLVTITADGQRARLAAIEAVEPFIEEVLTQFDTSQFAAGLPLLEQLRTFLDLRRDATVVILDKKGTGS
ncbi:MAG: DNA-binding MarR family transcriptional regulator [Candidatus Azotimanducaceae bacterium]|jgi:DNA-binding MarR family transcriptional regulator